MKETKKKVLIVDDDNLLAGSIKQILEKTGYEAMILLSGDEVETTVIEWKPDAILLDIMLPGKTGIDIIKDLCDVQNGICERIVVMTTLNDSTYLAKAIDLGIKNYVQKNTATPQSVVDVAVRIMNK